MYEMGAISREDAVAACEVTRASVEGKMEGFLLFVRSICDAALGNTDALAGAWPSLHAALVRGVEATPHHKPEVGEAAAAWRAYAARQAWETEWDGDSADPDHIRQ